MNKIKKNINNLYNNAKFFLKSSLKSDIQQIDQIIEEQRKELKKQDEKIKQLTTNVEKLQYENEFLLTRSFNRDHWLAKAKNKHEGKRCFLLATGPSLNKVDLKKIESEFTMGVNGICLLDNINLDYFVSVSYQWWENHAEKVRSLKCTRKFFPPYLSDLDSEGADISWLKTIEYRHYKRVFDERPMFFSQEADRYVCLGGTVITVCLQILYHLGFHEIIILGLDHNFDHLRVEDGQKGGLFEREKLQHFINNYYTKQELVQVDVEAMERGYRLADEIYKAEGKRIINASPDTKLDIFDKVEYNSLF